MNKLLTKTVKKFTLLSAIMAVVLVFAIVVTAIFGVNYSANLKDSNTLTVTVNRAYFKNEDKRQAVETLCEDKLDALGYNYKQESLISGDDCEIVYSFDATANLQEVKVQLQKAFDEKTKAGAEWDDAFITVASASEKVASVLPASRYVRVAIATVVFAVLAFLYVLIRYNLISALVAGASALFGALLTASVLILTRIPFTASSLYAIVVASLLSVVTAIFSLNAFRKELRKTDKSIITPEQVSGARAVKESAGLAVALAVALVVFGAIATTAMRWFALSCLVGVAVAFLVGLPFAGATYYALRVRSDNKSALSTKSGYVGAKKAEDKENEE